MRMQELEQWQPSEQEWQPGQEYGEYRAQFAKRNECQTFMIAFHFLIL